MGNHLSSYQNYSADQFAANEQFRQWVSGDTTLESFWQNYLQQYPHQQPAIFKARKQVEASLRTGESQVLTETEKSVLKNNIFRQIDHYSTGQRPAFRMRVTKLLKVAAMLACIVIIPGYFIYKQPKPENLLVKHTAENEMQAFFLPDSTVVMLNANSSITYNREIGTVPGRELTLEGNAYFMVKKKADKRPFTVHANSLRIAVLGTEFDVNARNAATEVVLSSGKVAISLPEPGGQSLNMVPGEKVQLDTLTKTLLKSRANTLLYSAWTDGKWKFSSTPLIEVTNLIYQYYGVKTLYASEKIKRLIISAVIPVTDLNSFTNIISKTLDLKITKYDNQLHIQF